MACHRPRGGAVAASADVHAAGTFAPAAGWGRFADQMGSAAFDAIPGWYYSGQAGAAISGHDYLLAFAFYGAATVDVFTLGRTSAAAKVSATAGGLVIGKMDDLARATRWRSGDHTLSLSKLPPGPGRWAQNERQLLNAMSTKRPIRDISPTKGGGFLDRERNLLVEHGWKFDPQTSHWSPGR